ncbi:hypothetical protein AKO1_008820 [Acrasis kona]|uniref:RWP-RK domain-containing protein n=1 Tax=Acrasis kona TaxID=1008807 RepID=A0AAW2ZH83_9EUKA
MKQRNYYLPQLVEIKPFFHLPLEVAANNLNISKTKLKKLCREYGLQSWPYRRYKTQNDIQVALTSINTSTLVDNMSSATFTVISENDVVTRNISSRKIQEKSAHEMQRSDTYRYSPYGSPSPSPSSQTLLPSLAEFFGENFLRSTDPRLCSGPTLFVQ